MGWFGVWRVRWGYTDTQSHPEQQLTTARHSSYVEHVWEPEPSGSESESEYDKLYGAELPGAATNKRHIIHSATDPDSHSSPSDAAASALQQSSPGGSDSSEPEQTGSAGYGPPAFPTHGRGTAIEQTAKRIRRACAIGYDREPFPGV